MSAICAIVHWDARPLRPGRIDQMLAAAPHRARDGAYQTVICGEGVSVGMGLGSSVTVPTEAKPHLLYDARQQVGVVADAVLYNRAQLAGELGIRSIETCDVIAAGYRKWREGVFDRLDGDFAIAIWDGRLRRLIAARDPFGVRVMHYWSDGRHLIVASEPKQIITAGYAFPEPDPIRLAEFIADQYNDLTRSFFRNISRVAPGHMLVADNDGVGQRRYWRPPLDAGWLDTHKQSRAEQLRSLLHSAVAKRLEAPSPVLIELSGGHDSTSIAALACEICDAEIASIPPVSAISYTYAGLDVDETAYIRAFLARYPLDWIEITRKSDTFGSLFEPAMWRTDSPLADLQIPMRSQAEAAAHARGARIVLSGFGGDEVLYDDHALRDLRNSGHIFALFQECATWRQLAGLLAPASIVQLARFARRRQAAQRPPWLSPQIFPYLPEPLPDPEGTTNLQRGLWRWLALHGRVSWTTGWCASGTDSFDLEPRFPFLDRELFTFLFSVPLHERLPRKMSKRLLRDAMARTLPPMILNRSTKTGFSAYYTLVLKQAWPQIRDRIRENNADAGAAETDTILEARGVEALISAWEREPCPSWELTYPLWRIACVKLWLGTLKRYRERLPTPTQATAAC